MMVIQRVQLPQVVAQGIPTQGSLAQLTLEAAAVAQKTQMVVMVDRVL